MGFVETPRARPMPHRGRSRLNSLLILGIFAMHNVLTGDYGAMAAHKTTSMAATAISVRKADGPTHATTAPPQIMAAGDGIGISIAGIPLGGTCCNGSSARSRTENVSDAEENP